MPWFLIDPSLYRYPIGPAGLSLGRAADNDVVLNDNEVSRHHAVIQVKEDVAWLFDRDSSNGTFLNDSQIHTPVRLTSGDRIRIGRTTLRVEEIPAPQPLPKAAPSLPPVSRPTSVWPAVVAGVGLGLVGLILVYFVFVRPLMQKAAVAPAQANTSYDVYQQALDAIVFVLTPIEGTESAAAGSGVVMGESGRILTAYRIVVDPNTKRPYNRNNRVLIGLNRSGKYDGRALRDWYLARVVRTDAQRDLAVLQIFALQDDSPLPNSFHLSPAPTQSVETLKKGDPLAVISFMASGGTQQEVGRALTIGQGSVLGFLPDSRLDVAKGWIESDIGLTLSNLGGLALDEQGKLVGLYTGARSGNADTPGSLLRPIDLADALLAGVR